MPAHLPKDAMEDEGRTDSELAPQFQQGSSMEESSPFPKHQKFLDKQLEHNEKSDIFCEVFPWIFELKSREVATTHQNLSQLGAQGTDDSIFQIRKHLFQLQIQMVRLSLFD